MSSILVNSKVMAVKSAGGEAIRVATTNESIAGEGRVITEFVIDRDTNSLVPRE